MKDAGKKQEQSLQKSTKNTALVMISTFTSRLLGFVRIAVIGAVFGATGQADVINAVFTIPNNLRKLLAEGALSSAFIPVLSSAIVQNSEKKRPIKIARNVLTFQFIILIPLCLLSIIFARPLISHVLINFTNPELTELSISLFRFLINYILLVSISAVMIAVLNSYNIFFIPAITPILFSISVIFSILFLHRFLGVFAMGVGVLVGGIAQILFQTPLFRRLQFDFHFDFQFRNRDFIVILKRWLPVAATASIFTINQQIAIRFATGLEIGSSTALAFALVFFQLPYGIFSASVTTVLFPRLSRQAADSDMDGLRETVQYGIRSLMVVLIPSAIILGLLGKEIISVALYRGEFTREATMVTDHVLTGYIIGLFFVGCYHFLQRFFYALGDYSATFRIALIVFVLDVGFSLWLKETRLRVVGLAVANSIAFSCGCLLMLFLAKRKVKLLNWKEIAVTLLKVTISMIPLICFLIGYKTLTGAWWEEGSTFKAFGLLLLSAVGSIVIIIFMYYLLNVEMMRNLIRRKTLVS